MLSLEYPEVQRRVYELSLGLMPFIAPADFIPKLIVKVSKETILTAKVRGGFSIYLIPYDVAGVKSVGFLAAFFDDQRSPITAGGAIFKEFMGRELFKLFQSPKVDVHFFDELGREMLAYRASFLSTKRHRDMLRRAVIPSYESVFQRKVNSALSEWFHNSGPDDDDVSIKVKFIEPLFPEDFIYFDMREDRQGYNGSTGYTTVVLEREEPGEYQEKEIIELLARTFGSKSIYHSPKRTYDKEEVADIVIVTSKSILIVQAKDSPNLERILNNTIDRKKTTARGFIKKALGQVSGAVGYLKRECPMRMLMSDDEIEVDWSGRKVYALVVVKELFDDEYDQYTPPMLDFYKKTGVPCIPLSYGELHSYTRYIQSEDGFFEAYMKVFSHGVETSMFPRLRIHPPGTII